MINPEALKYFTEIAQTQNMSRAAERLGVTQPTLSHSMKRLEIEVGHDLFIRSKKGLQLTAAGKRLLEKTDQLLLAWDRMLISVNEEVTEVTGRVRLGCHTAVAQYTLPLLLPNLLQQNPALTVTLTHGLSRHMTEMVVSDQLDVAFVVNPSLHPDLIIKEFARDQVTVWIPKGCLNKDVLLVEPHLLQSQDILSKLQKKGIHFSRIVESSSLEVLAQLVNSGAGCAILPERVVRAFADTKVVAMKDAPVFVDRICVVYKPEFRKLKRGAVFLQNVGKSFPS